MFVCNCEKIFEKRSSLTSHARFCDLYKKIEKKTKYINDEGSYVCECGKIFQSHQSLNGHFNYCLVHRKGEPSRREKWPNKGSMNGWSRFSENEILEFRKKSRTSLGEKIKKGEIKPSFLGKKHTNETKQKMSDKASENNNGYVKCMYYDVYCPYRGKLLKVQGGLEKKYAEYLNEKGIMWDRDRKNNIKYKLNKDDYTHTYYPDFYLPCTKEYVEVKGFWWKSKDGRVDDKRKMDMVVKCNPDKKIKIIEKEDIDDLIK